jgi:hypothetical protein
MTIPTIRSFAATSRVVAVMALLGATALGQEARAEICGQLAGVKGDGVEILRMQADRGGEQVRHGMRVEQNKVLQLECDDIVLTGRDSNAKIILANGKISLGPDSRIEIAQHTKSAPGAVLPKVSLINLTYGKMRALIQKRTAAEQPGKAAAAPNAATGASPAPQSEKPREATQIEFRVRTFSAVAGVRGTDFFTSYEPNSGLTEQATIEGSVEVQQAGTTQSVLVGSGKQVAVETTPAAIKAYETQLKTGKIDLEPPKSAPSAQSGAPALKPLEVVPIRDSLRNEMRVASAIVRDDKEFAHSKAVEILGKPATWTLEREKVPEKLDKLKNEF